MQAKFVHFSNCTLHIKKSFIVQKIPLHIAQAQAGSAAAFYEQYSQPDKQKLATCPKLNKDPCIV